MYGEVIIGTELNTEDFEREIQHLTKYLVDLEDDYERISKEKPFEGQEEQLKKLSSQIVQTKKKIQAMTKAKEEFNKKGFPNLQDIIQNIGSGIEDVTKKIGKWALAIFGIRSALNFVRSSVSTLSQYNEQIGVDIDYIRYLLASTLQKVVEGLIKAVYKLLIYINSISVALFSYNLFANASVEAFQKQNKALGSAVKNAKELKKTLAGFDEMNIIQDNKDTSSSGGGGVLPSVDPTQMLSDETAETFKNFWIDIIDFWENEWADYFSNIGGAWGAFVEGLGITLKGFYDVFKGIIEVLIGLWDILVGIFTGDYEKLQLGWEKLCDGIKNIFIGLLEILLGLLLSALGIIKGLLIELLGSIYNILIKPVADFFVWLLDNIKTEFDNGIKWIKDKFNSMVNFFKNIIGTIVNLFREIGIKVGDVVGGAFKGVINGVLSAIENILNFPIKSINKLIDTINSIPGVSLGKLSTFKLPRLAKGGIINNPGRGVYTGSAIAGEAGKEFYMPLQDEQMLNMVGEAIGRYITINANITNTMNGRVISRELQKIQNRDDFLYNR